MQRMFLVGCSRSGTTLLQSMIASHSKVVSFPETHLFSKTIPTHQIGRWLKIYEKSSCTQLLKFMKDLELSEEQTFLPSSTILRSREWSRCLLKNIDQLANHHAGRAASHWLEKTPRHLWYIELISDVDPDTKFIHMIRRGEDVAASMYFATKNYPEQWGGPRSIKKCVFWWNRSIKNALPYLNQKNHIFISYEQLINKPEIVMKSFCDKINLIHQKKMHNSFHKTASSLIKQKELWKEKNTSNKIYKSNKFDRLTSEDQEYIKENVVDFPFDDIYF
jgi:hypothetical protein